MVAIKPDTEQTHKHLEVKSKNPPSERSAGTKLYILREKNLFHKIEMCITIYCRVVLVSETLIFRKQFYKQHYRNMSNSLSLTNQHFTVTLQQLSCVYAFRPQ